MKRKVSIQLSLFQFWHGDARAIEIAKQIGADGVDIDLSRNDYRKPESIYSKSDREIEEYFTGLYEKAQSLGLSISQTHGRLQICSDQPEDTEANIRNARLDCLATRCLHSPIVVMHGVTKRYNGMEPTPENIFWLNETLFCRILEFAKQYQVKVATETIGDGDVEYFGQIREFLKTYRHIADQGDNKNYFVTCVDTGHTNDVVGYSNNPSVGDAIRLLGSSIGCLHLHDNDGSGRDQHRTLFSGNIDWADIFDALDEVGYSGWYNLEVGLRHLKDFGRGFEKEYAAYSVKLLRFMLAARYGAENCCIQETDRLWADYAQECAQLFNK